MEDLKAALYSANAAVALAEREYNDLIRNAKQEAEKRIRLFFSPLEIELSKLRETAWKAKRAVELAEIEKARNAGVKVGEKMFRVGNRVTRKETGTWGSGKVVWGVVEVRTHETQFPDNRASYSLPSIGDLFVRVLTKDGKLGKKFERLNSWCKWTVHE